MYMYAYLRIKMNFIYKYSMCRLSDCSKYLIVLYL